MNIYFKKQDNNKRESPENTSRGYEDGTEEKNVNLFNDSSDVLILLLDFGILLILLSCFLTSIYTTNIL